MSDAVQALRHRLDDLLDAHDRPGAVAEALGAVESGKVELKELYHDILAPLMKDVGGRWQQGQARVWEEHLVTVAVRTIIDALYPQVQRLKESVAPAGRSVVLACPADEQHDLGLRMLSDMFDVSGWTTYLLGADTPTRQMADAAATLRADLLLIATTTLVDRVQVRHVLDELHERLPGVRIVVAGCEADCEERGLRPDEIFTPREFFGAVTPAGETEA